MELGGIIINNSFNDNPLWFYGTDNKEEKPILDNFNIIELTNGLCRIGEYSNDVMAKMLNLRETQYEHIMVHQFKGHNGNPNRVYFDNRVKAEKALDWIISKIIMEKLNK